MCFEYIFAGAHVHENTWRYNFEVFFRLGVALS